MAADLCPWEASHLVAAATGDVAKLQEELEKGADVNYPDDKYERTALFWAAERGYEDAVKLLISHGAGVNFSEPNHGRTPLFATIENGHEAVARHLIQSGARVDTGDTNSETPLIFATRDGRFSLTAPVGNHWHGQSIEQGHDEIVQILLNREADAASTDAADHGLKKEALFSAYADLVSGLNEERLKWALERRYSSVAKQLLEPGADPEHKDNTGKTPLILAAEKGDEEGRTPLSYGAEKGHAEIVTLLLDKAADLHSEDDQEMTPLTVAALRGHESIVSLLLEKGADADHWDNGGFSPPTHTLKITAKPTLCPWNVLGGGQLRTKTQLETRQASEPSGRGSRQSEEARRISAELENIAAKHGDASIQQIALAYVMHKAPRVFPIIGGRKVEHLHDNIRAPSICLSDDDVRSIENLSSFDIGFPLNFIGDDPRFGETPAIFQSLRGAQIAWK
ncbi:aldo/keto reductase [Seiridium cupressi]